MEYKNKTVVKSMSLLNLFLNHERLTLNEMVQLLQAPKTSVYRMVGSFHKMGFLQKDTEGKYFLGLLFLQFGQLVSERLNIRNVVLPIMKELRDSVNEAVNLIVRDDDDAVYIEKVDTSHPVRIYNSPGRRAPMYAGACPRILLSFMNSKEQVSYLHRVQLHPIGRNTITDLNELKRVLDEARERGYSISHSELQNDTSAVAAPLLDHTGSVVAGLSIAGPTSRFSPDNIPDLINRLLIAAHSASRELGWNGLNAPWRIPTNSVLK